ncbi:hypothetical protein EVJ32_05175 [Exiguobacterium sp. SH5S4]|uniref:cohesin domain-containing protein n=1 Tax=Exiguobacterium sp. SH5S4 TaxID=2510961 RepID=UPI00103DB82E|nr:cohesin domain-containing protein [Exiguobacterium sp. SH5S4]TCI26770.1 hypothetical protein EVJ32_05175 [Exiguobacterium sp. SH5S4]
MYGLRDIVDLTFWTPDANGKERPEFIIDSLKSASVEGGAETTDLRGGRGNALYTIFESQRDITVECTDALLIPELFAARMGAELKKFTASETGEIRKAEQKAFSKQVDLGVAAFKLERTPKTAAEIGAEFISVDGDVTPLVYSATAVTSADADEFSYDEVTNTVNFSYAVLDKDGIVRVWYVAEVTSGEQIVVDSDKFATKTYRVTGDCFVKNVEGSQEREVPAQIDIQRAKFNSAFSLAFAPDGDPQTFSFTLRALKTPGNTELMKITMYE